MSSPATLNASTPAWIATLKNALGHNDEPYPGTPAYQHRQALTQSIDAQWQHKMCQLLSADLDAGVEGRRKHFWEEMECLVVYDLQATRSGRAVEMKVMHATHVFCHSFSGKAFCEPTLPQLPINPSRPMAIRSRISASDIDAPTPRMPKFETESIATTPSPTSSMLSLPSLSSGSGSDSDEYSSSSAMSTPSVFSMELEPVDKKYNNDFSMERDDTVRAPQTIRVLA